MKAENIRAEQQTSKLDLVTVCFSADLHLLKLQARSIGIYVDPQMVGKILIIINDRRTGAIRRYIEQNILKEYGPLASKVEILSARKVGGFYFGKLAWGTQQALKLLAANFAATPTLMILDCKTHFIRALSKDSVWTSNGRIKTRQYKVIENFRRYFDNACDFFDVKDRKTEHPALPTVPPFIVPTNIIVEMIKEMERKENRGFLRLFMQKKRRFTEFYLVHAYILSRFGSLDAIFKQIQFQATALIASDRKDMAHIRGKIAKLENTNIYSFGVHRAVISELHPKAMEEITSVWSQYGLLDPAENDQTEFLTPTTFPKWPLGIF